MPLLDRGGGVDVRLPRSQQPLGFWRMVLAVFIALWAFVVSLWVIAVVVMGAALNSIDGFGS
jgi:hypothetical protein